MENLWLRDREHYERMQDSLYDQIEQSEQPIPGEPLSIRTVKEPHRMPREFFFSNSKNLELELADGEVVKVTVPWDFQYKVGDVLNITVEDDHFLMVNERTGQAIRIFEVGQGIPDEDGDA
jgi:hypothetical protein